MANGYTEERSLRNPLFLTHAIRKDQAIYVVRQAIGKGRQNTVVTVYRSDIKAGG